jgi:hypothetical protein
MWRQGGMQHGTMRPTTYTTSTTAEAAAAMSAQACWQTQQQQRRCQLQPPTPARQLRQQLQIANSAAAAVCLLNDSAWEMQGFAAAQGVVLRAASLPWECQCCRRQVVGPTQHSANRISCSCLCLASTGVSSGTDSAAVACRVTGCRFVCGVSGRRQAELLPARVLVCNPVCRTVC